MPPRRLATLAILVATAGLAPGCGQSDGPGTRTPEPAPLATPAAPTPEEAPPPGKSPVVILASANGSVEPMVEADWPIVVEAQVFLKPDAGATLTLANPAGAWSDALELECIGPGGLDRSSRFVPAYASNKSIELTPERSGLMVWILDGAGPGTLSEGTWRIRAVLDEKKLGNAVPAGLGSRAIHVTVIAKDATLSPGAAQRKCLAIMSAFAWKADTASALAAADAHLAKNPEDVAVLFMKGQLLRSEGRKVEALATFEAALRSANSGKAEQGENFAVEKAVAVLRRELAGR